MKIFILTNYKNNFGSKSKDKPYRSGYDLKLLESLFRENGFEPIIISFSEIKFEFGFWKDQFVVYTSSEEKEYQYKSYIEDVIAGLENLGARTIPGHQFLRANNNKVFMEILSQTIIPENLNNNKALIFGSLEEVENAYQNKKIDLPCVIKKAAGAKSRGVFLANNFSELIQYSKKATDVFNLKSFLKERIRMKKHNGYKPESQYQNKIVIQPFIPNLKNDWKILIYGEKYFILKRSIRPNDFRASGSGYNYAAGSKSGFPLEQLNYVRNFFKALNIPNLSVDFAFDGEKPYVLEFQALYFGTSTILMSDDYYEFQNGNWVVKTITENLEEIYVKSIVEYIHKK
ncbi:ATP-grasp domain-containing protein [Flavobacterium sp. PLA-1-15]|uniref:ATP-grasp domain-containing protein n=1 Tax=Flavobacterium sp. PLA-1-15 TaxID=3380533 RepID=UPI003B7796C4